MVCQVGVLPLGWMYINEVANHKALTVGVGANWFLLVLTGVGTGPLFLHPVVGEYAFLIFAAINTLTLIVLFLFLKETKDLTNDQVSVLYLKDKNNSVWGWKSNSNSEIDITKVIPNE